MKYFDPTTPVGVKVSPGIRRTSHGWQLYAKVRGQFVSQHLATDTTIDVLKKALGDLKAKGQLGLPTTVRDDGQPTLAADVREYVKAKAGMPTIADRTHRIEWWRDTLGRQRSRESVTAVEVRQHLEAKRKAGAKAGTLNLYRTALLDFFLVINGREGVNPVRAVPKYHEQELPLELPSIEEAGRAIDHAIHQKQPRDGGTKSQARLRVLLWTGWPSAILKQVKATDIQWAAQTIILHGRKKGGGTKPKTVPLLPQAVEALKTFDALDAYGSFSGSALHSTLHRGCDAAGVRRFRVYDLRHLFGTSLVSASHDERGVAEAMMHTSPQQTWRYSRHAASARAQSAIDAMKAAFPMPGKPKPRLVKRA